MERGDGSPHTWIAQLTSGKFVESENSSGILILESDQPIRRCRLFGIVVSTGDLVIDDGTGSILIRSFEKTFPFEVGTIVLAIGRPRVYNGQCYLLGEIVKPIDPKWAEIARRQHPYNSPPPQNQQTPSSPETSAVDIVRTLDSGDGADYQEVLTKLGTKGEELIVHLLAMGELFETRPGRLKVLE